jgi:parallel beta-helix repeat protein
MGRGHLLVGLALLPAFTSIDRGIRVDATGRSCPEAAFTRIQDALDAARPGATIRVCAGVYPEQLVVRKRVVLRGDPGAVVRPGGVVANATSLRTGRPIAALAAVTARATITGLEFDGSENGLTGCHEEDPLLIGVFFRGTAGTLLRNRVHGIMLGPADAGCETGAAVLVQGEGRRFRVTIEDNVIFDYQRAGIVVNEPGSRAVIVANTVSGRGPTPELPQNGIQVGFGARAKVLRNVVQNNTGPNQRDCMFDGGNLSFESDDNVIAGNTFTGNAASILVTGSRNRILRNVLDGLGAGAPEGLIGIGVLGHGNVVARNEVRNMSGAGIRFTGQRNRVVRNLVSDTRGDTLCRPMQARPGCGDALSACGVGLWVAGGTQNVVRRNVLAGNDVAIQDDGTGSLVTPSASP